MDPEYCIPHISVLCGAVAMDKKKAIERDQTFD